MPSRRTTISLDTFELVGLDVGVGVPSDLAIDRDLDWIPAVVPGGVHESLLDEGVIEHPYYGANEAKAQWIQSKEWWYRATFPAPDAAAGDAVHLVFEGLDTVADVYFNGAQLGHHENMFRSAVFDATPHLADSNTLLVRFTPPLLNRTIPPQVRESVQQLINTFAAMMTEEPLPGGFELTPELIEASGSGGMLGSLPRATTLRKAAFSWGWDFGCALPNIGIWRPAYISVEPGPVLLAHHVAVIDLASDHSSATVAVTVETSTPLPGELNAEVTIVAPSGLVHRLSLPVKSPRKKAALATGSLVIDNPELWWTHDLGVQALHAVTIELVDAHGVCWDACDDTVGLRTLVLDQRTDDREGGRLFQFVLNGVALFIRGANWLPASMMFGSVPGWMHHDRVLRAQEGNLNMLRVWGGGVYEHDSFYAACDELGVLVWQDFMFANIDYPSNSAILKAEVSLEARFQVRRLRNRACLAIWAGGNENEIVHRSAWGNVDPGNWGWHFFHEILPTAVAEHDPHTPYWPNSPWGDPAFDDETGRLDGDRHSWEAWHGMTAEGTIVPGHDGFSTIGDARHYRRYAEDTAKFVSEFGIHSSPDMDTLKRWIPDSDLWIHSPTLDLHNKDNPKNKGDKLLEVTTGLPDDLAEYVEYTQAVQAEGMAFAIEHYRRRQPHTAGALMWEFNDVWPGLSWSIIDYDGVPKSAYYAARRASAPIAASFRVVGDTVELWIANNTRADVDTDVTIEIGQFSGIATVTETVHVCVALSTSSMVWSSTQVQQDASHYIWASSPQGLFPEVRKHFVEIGDLNLSPCKLEVEVQAAALRIKASGYAYSVRISQPWPGIRLSDNCFDLRDGDARTITVTGVDPALLEVATYPIRHSAR